jgi:DNA invertase Pin-like site-specific DNA recombinase
VKPLGRGPRIGVRVRAGQARGGRPRVDVDAGELLRRRQTGESWRSIARTMGASVRTLRRVWQNSQEASATLSAD